MNRLLLTATILAFFSPGISAQNYNPKFDKAPDLGEFRKAATEDPALQTNIPYPPVVVIEAAKTISLEAEVLPSLRKELLKAGAGYFYGPYPPRIYNSVPYQNGQVYASRLQGMEHPTAYKLLAQWETINTTRSGLLSEANALDPRDRSLYAEAVQLDQNAAVLNQERDKINAEVAQWNQQCAGQYPTPYCTNWGNDLDRRLADLKRRIATHNAKVDNWKARKRDFDGVVGSFVNKVQQWETTILYFIRMADAFLNGQSVCVLQREEHETQMVGNPPKPVFLSSCFYACTPDGHEWTFMMPPSSVTFPACPKVVIDGEIPIKSIQRQSPDFTDANKLLK